MKYRLNLGVILIVVGLIFSTIGAAIVKAVVVNPNNNFTGLDNTIALYLPTFMLLGGLAMAGVGAMITYRSQ